MHFSHVGENITQVVYAVKLWLTLLLVSVMIVTQTSERINVVTRIAEIQSLVRDGLYYLTEHADDEAIADGFDIYDVEQGVLSGKVRRTWPKESTFEIVGFALDKRRIGIVCRITKGGKVRVITVYEDNPK